MKLYSPLLKRLDHTCYCKGKHCWLSKQERKYYHRKARKEMAVMIRQELQNL